MIDYVSIQEKMYRSREGTSRLALQPLFAYDLKYIN
jgi:hypothetical protein